MTRKFGDEFWRFHFALVRLIAPADQVSVELDPGWGRQTNDRLIERRSAGDERVIVPVGTLVGAGRGLADARCGRVLAQPSASGVTGS